jgi:hypothetical protein
MDNEFNELENLLLNLASGLPIENLSKQEIELLEKEYGENWKNLIGK